MRRALTNCLRYGIAIIMLVLAACGGGDGNRTPPLTGGTVTGVVRDMATGTPLAGVTVTDGSSTATTDANGVYTMPRPAGTYTLTVSAAGYGTTSRICSVPAGGSASFNWSLSRSPGVYWNYSAAQPGRMIPAATMNYVVVAWNDLGMHCAQDDYSYFCVLPPFNTLHVQVIQRGVGVVTSGITVSYAFPKKTDSARNTNFWQYAAKYGWNVPPNIGITGTPLAGTMAVDANNLGFVATGIPVTPYDDDGTWDPYGTATITVTNTATGAVLQTASVVVPVSTEMNCSNCHGMADTYLNILQTHDRRTGTTLAADQAKGVLHLCAECHADNALGLAGKPGVTNLSLAMHGFHRDKMVSTGSSQSPECYNCHPGPRTNCLRGIMSHAGQTCTDCHGNLSAMTTALQNGRKPWLEEPRCGDCHGSLHQENSATLYRNSIFTNSPDPKMNGQLYCAACHNSPHAEFSSTNHVDNGLPQKYQGDSYWLWNCYVCHTDYMPAPSTHQ
ncbi:carboxypeptidase-like regulatory domain-containing protein [Geobacter pickeringii]|uniref:Uncharacterized protein n=1 Tax=Geobacter pickeringii TaxID=345632 RepID=A0A0B5BJ95_9BACT|nr:carboxypeptidase-like regulatory domain-containing protein [Geobacter pickeringii]AJE04136.1 hypothetical protein GPICK_12910 [Geobacter pickeringii]